MKNHFLAINYKKSITATVAATLCVFALAQEPAIVYDMGGKFDKSFNEAAYRGIEKWKAESKKKYLDFEVSNEAQREQSIRRMAERGASPIIVTGFSQASAIEKVAKEFPKINFAIIDAVVDAPNVQSITFKEHEGSFLVGVMAAYASNANKVGFIGGMDVPLIRNFQCGYAQGVRYVNDKIDVYANMTGTTGSAWNDPVRGGELAKGQFSKGADVVFAAAGATGNGVLQAAKDAGKLSIGVDSNQNHIHPGSVLTSMIKKVDVAVYNAITNFTPGITVLGVKENGVDFAIDEYNEKLVTPEMRAAVEEAKKQIIDGTIKVVSYYDDNNCK